MVLFKNSPIHLWTTGVVIILRLDSIHMMVCPYNWFGTNCRTKCNCKRLCENSLVCEDGDSCKDGYFGDLCQYRDLAFHMKSQSFPILTDNDNSTCITISSTTRVSVFMGAERFSFLILVAKVNSEPGILDSIRIELKLSNVYIQCDSGNYSLSLANNTRKYVCSTRSNVSEVELSGSGVSSLCTVNIGGGRNLALKQNYMQSLQTDGSASGEGAVDGSFPLGRWFDNSSCFYARTGTAPTYFQLFFNEPVVIYYFILVNAPDEMYWNKMINFELTSYDENNNTVMTFKENGDPPGGKNSYVISHNTREVAIASFKLEMRSKPDNFLQFCEIEAYGECAPGTYDLQCSRLCSSQCTNTVCGLMGECDECNEGFYGDKCDRTCSNCLDSICLKSNGTCINGCSQGFYTATCDKTCGLCSEKGTCNNITGECPKGCDPGYLPPKCITECPMGKYGNNCSSECSPNCQSDCSHVNGKCFNCVDGKFGNNCELSCSENCGDKGSCDISQGYCLNGCKKGFYGTECIIECSKNCSRDMDCDPSNGFCISGCKVGYSGSMCDTVCPSHCGGENKSCDSATGWCLNGCMQGFGQDDCSVPCKNCVDDVCEQYSMNCTKGCKEDFHGDNCSMSVSTSSPLHDASTLVMTVGLLILVTAIVLLTTCFLRKKVHPPLQIQAEF
uniref:EGF-like domain-containing protein n=1 Tax=Biomphalaria glabrata TaxID=6526 RepID=A0A2C9LA66_BIOGL